MPIGALVLIKKPTLSVSVSMSRLCISSCFDASELKLGMGVGAWAPEVCGQLFEATPPKVKGHPEVNLP